MMNQMYCGNLHELNPSLAACVTHCLILARALPLQCLKEEDRCLPFIIKLLPMLQAGIAVHHSGECLLASPAFICVHYLPAYSHLSRFLFDEIRNVVATAVLVTSHVCRPAAHLEGTGGNLVWGAADKGTAG
jgi:hypothetical protein